jgi:hypothetical protein
MSMAGREPIEFEVVIVLRFERQHVAGAGYMKMLDEAREVFAQEGLAQGRRFTVEADARDYARRCSGNRFWDAQVIGFDNNRCIGEVAMFTNGAPRVWN